MGITKEDIQIANQHMKVLKLINREMQIKIQSNHYMTSRILNQKEIKALVRM